MAFRNYELHRSVKLQDPNNAWFTTCARTRASISALAVALPWRAPGHHLLMTREHVIRIYVKPYVRKYLLRKLGEPSRLHWDDGAKHLVDRINAKLRGRKLVALVNDYHHGENGRAYLDLIVTSSLENAELSWFAHRYLSPVLHKEYMSAMFYDLDWFQRAIPVPLASGPRAAIMLWQRCNSITEDEHSLETIERLYRERRNPRRKEREALRKKRRRLRLRRRR
jgi:hypothetical protein